MRAFVLTVGLFVSSVASAGDASIRFAHLYEPGGGGAIVSLEVSPHDGKHLVSGGDMLGVATSFDGGDSWQATFGFASYEMATPTFHPTDPNVVWIGSCMGPYKSTDRGIRWSEQRAGMPAPVEGKYTAIVEKVLFDPDQPTRLLAFGGSSRRWNKADSFGWVWQSTDDGQNWTHLTTLTKEGARNEPVVGGNIVWAEYAPKSNDTIHALLDGGTWLRSQDDGRTWDVHVPTGISGRLEFVTFDPTDAQIVYASTSSTARDGAVTVGGVFKSVDGGKTFTPSDAGIGKVSSPTTYDFNTTSHFSNVVVSKADRNVLYVNDRAYNASVVYKSDDAGASWHAVATKRPIGQSQGAGDLSKAFPVRTATHAGLSMRLAIDPNDAARVYGYNTEFVLRTHDAGRTWDDATAYNPDPARPDHWRGRGWNGWCATEVRFNPYKPTQLIIQAMDAARAWVSDDDGHSWHYAETDTHPWLGGNAITFAKDGSIYGTTGHFGQVNGLTRSRDGGKTWESLAGEERGLPPKGWNKMGTMGGIYAHPDRAGHVWAVVNGKILHTTDHGEKWSPISDKGKFSWIEGDPTNPDRFYASAADGTYVVEDGKKLSNIGGPRPVNRSKLHIDAKGRLYAAQWRQGVGGVWRYEPSNKKWTRLIDDAQAIDIATDPKDPSRIVFVTSMDPYYDRAGGNGVWVSHDDGKSWSKQIEGLPMLRANCVEFDPKTGERFIVGTYGRGFFEATWRRDFRPAGTRSYAHTDADTAHARPAPGGHLVKDFGPASFDYTYGETWKNGATVQADSAGVTIDGTEFGGGGLVLSEANLAPNGETKLVVRLRTLPGNEADGLSINLNGLPGGNKTLTLPLPAPSDSFRDVEVALPSVAGGLKVEQLQIQGRNFSAGAAKVKVLIDSVRTTGGNGNASESASAPPTPESGPRPPLRNGDMEEGETTPWNWLASGNNASIVRDTETVKSGAASLKLTVNGGEGHGLQRLDLKPGDKLRVSGFVKSAGEVKVNACVMSFKAGGQFLRFDQLKYVQNASDWSDFDRTLALPAETEFVQIGVMAQGKGTAWLDDVKLQINGADAMAQGIKPQPTPPGAKPPAKGLPNTPANGFYPAYPSAWQSLLNQNLERARKGNIDIVLLGDSITQGWGDTTKGRWKDAFPNHATANFGIGGDSTRQVLYRIEKGILDGYEAKLVILRIGTNNLYSDFNAGSDKEIADGIKACVEKIRAKQPGAKVLVLGMLPRQNNFFISRINKINALTRQLDDGKNVFYKDIGAAFKVSDDKVVKELFQKDELHLNDAGYAKFMEQIRDTVAGLLAR